MNEFNLIAGYEKEKEELVALVDVIKNRKQYESKGGSLPKGIIFYGEAGTGKTLFAQVLSHECGLNTIKIDISRSDNAEGICKQIRKAFSSGAKSKKPSMIFFDELDKVLPNDREEYYTDQSKIILTQLLTLIDGMDSSGNIIFVATCNDYYSLPSSITRPGRFDKKIGIGLPDHQSRVAILKMYAGRTSCKFALPFESISKLCGGFSCAAIRTFINECVLRSDENNFISETVIREKVSEINNEDLVTKKSEFCYKLNAIRSLGSFVVSRSLCDSSYLLSMASNSVCNSFLNGVIFSFGSDYYDDYYDYDEDDESDGESTEVSTEVYSSTDYVMAITAILGGFASQEIILGKIYDNIPLIQAIDAILIQMSKCGMLGLDMMYIEDRNNSFPYSDERLERINKRFEEITEECYDRAKAIVEANKELIKKLTPILVDQESIEKKQCEEIIDSLGGLKT